MATYRVLSLDGGGIRGLLTTVLLRRLCDEPGLARFIESVDLIAGNSSGGLVALALAHGLGCPTARETLDKIEQVFLDGRNTFGADFPWWLGGRVLVTKFGTRARAASFRASLGDLTLGDLRKKVLVTTFDLDDEGLGERSSRAPRRWRPKIFHNFIGEGTDAGELAWKVALYTTAGPTYFPTADGYIDGGVYSNNPSMCALAQLFDPRYPPTRRLDDIVVLSVGAGLNLRHIPGRRRRWGFVQWGKHFVQLIGDGTIGIADYQCSRLLGDQRYRRIEPTFAPGVNFGLDDLDRIRPLKEFAEAVPIAADAAWIRENWMPAENPAPARAVHGYGQGDRAPRAPLASLPPAREPVPARRDPVRRDRSRDGLKNRLFFWLFTHLEPVWKTVQAVPPAERVANALLINKAVKYAPPRPHPLTTRAPYPSWGSLTDRTFYGRHLPPAPAWRLPDVNDVAALFRRPDGEIRESRKSTALFAYFAQWFIDGVLRTDFNLYPERTHKNTSTHEIDLANLYGRNETQTAALREGYGGRLRSQFIRGEEFPPFYYAHDANGRPVVTCNGDLLPAFDAALAPLLPPHTPLPIRQRSTLFAMGGERVNITPGYTMMNVLFLREHNRIAAALQSAYGSWDDERLFQTTRNILVVVLLKIVIEDYINHIAPYHFKFRLFPGRRIRQEWHRPNWVTLEFNLLYRWHGLMPEQIDFVETLVDAQQVLFRNDLLLEHGLANAFAGATRQKAGEIGLLNTPAFLVADTDVRSLRMGRNAGLRTYNDYRELCQFPRVNSPAQISSNPIVREGLMDLYGEVDHIELYTGLFAEDARPNSALPQLMGRMVGIDAFSQALTNPLLSPQLFHEQTFSAKGLEIIASTSRLGQLVERNIARAPVVSFTHASYRRQ